MKIFYYFIFLFLSLTLKAQENLRINELSSRNDQAILDEDGNDSDWIEIYNSSEDTIQLHNFYLTDDKDLPWMWRFPDKKILPGEYLVIFASGKNRTKTADHWETPLNGDSLWRYLNPTEQNDYDYINWTEPDFYDEDWEWKRGAFGTGYENIETESNDTLRCIYLRNEFYLSDTSQVLGVSLHAFFDDGFTVFLNGYEIHREHMLNNGVKPKYATPAFPSHVSTIDLNDPPQRFDIKPIIWNNLIKNGRNVLALQNHNFWDQFPLVIKPWLSIAMTDSIIQTHLIAEELSTPPIYLHTNFKLNADGEKIYLFNMYGEEIQQIDIPELQADISYGYHPQAEDSLVLFEHATPGFINSNSSFTGFVKDTCHIISESGFYQDSVLVEIVNNDTLLKAYYTLDGSLPDTNAYLFDSAFWIDSSLVFRIQYFSDSLLPGPISNYSWFINDSSQLEVYSLITDPENLWDEEYGIYAFGNQYWPDPPYFEANFWQKWERPVHIQHLTVNGLNWKQDAGLKIHGNFTRMLPQKSLGLYAKSKYGNNRFDQKLISQKPYLNNFKRFLLRNAGNDNLLSHFRDLLIHKRMSVANLDVQQGYPVSSYLNGEYWGIYHVREKIDRYYLEQNQGVDPDEVNLLEQNGRIIDGNRNAFENLIDYIHTYDLNEDQHYHFIIDKIDIENWIDLYIANLYHFNTDWPHHNSKFWNAPGRKWQQILVDLDVSMGITSHNRAFKNPLPAIHKDSLSYLAVFYKELLQNSDFKRHYFNRFADLMNTIFLPSEYLMIFDSLKAKMEPEMQRHCERWNMNYNNWVDGYYTQNISDFIEDRSAYMRQFLRERYELGSYDTIQLSVDPEGKGLIKLNTISINENNWQGLYFDSIPVKIEAIPNPGFEFVRWESNSSPHLADSGRILYNYHLKTSDDITAIFFSESGLEDTLDVAITEINYRNWENASTGDWIEIYNREPDTIILTNWKIKGLKPYKEWKINKDIKIAPDEYLVLVQDTVAFSLWHPDVEFTGPFIFDLEEDEMENISLYDQMDRLVCSMSFSHTEPWPDNSETARTIELNDATADYHLADNWQLGCPGGSPRKAPQDCQIEYPLVITEINYNSRPDFVTEDWIELYNAGNDKIDLSHWMIRDGNPDNSRQIPMDLTIDAGEYIIFLQDTGLFFNEYDTNGKWFGPLNFGLSAQGESIQLSNPFGQEIIHLIYSDQSPWPDDAGSNGVSIELIDPALNMFQGENWMANCFLGTPWKAPEWCIQPNSIWISEVKYQSAPDSISGDWIELYNTNKRAIDLMSWKFIIHGDTLTIDTSYQIPAEDYVVLISDPSQFYSVYDTAIFSIQLDHFDLRKVEDAIAMIDPYKNPGQILNYHYLLDWPVFQTDTNNRTLELINYTSTFIPENWRAGCDFGTPSLPPYYCNTDGIETMEEDLQFNVVPNPTTAEIQIEIQILNPGDYEFNIIDYQGRILLKQSIQLISVGENTIPLDLQRLKSGIYLLQIISDQKSGQTKIIKIEE